MCSCESGEWHEKKANVKRPESTELNSQGCITLKKRHRKKIKEGVVGGWIAVLVFLVCAHLLMLRIQEFRAEGSERRPSGGEHHENSVRPRENFRGQKGGDGVVRHK